MNIRALPTSTNTTLSSLALEFNTFTHFSLLRPERLVEVIFTMSSTNYSTLTAAITLATALPSASLNQSLATLLSEQSSQFPSIQELPPPQGPSGIKGKREMSRHQWEDIKPLIQRIYIDENKPFPYLADILRTKHGFEPT